MMVFFGVTTGYCCLDLRGCLGEALAVEVQGGSHMRALLHISRLHVIAAPTACNNCY